jgi:hypothetical protein
MYIVFFVLGINRLHGNFSFKNVSSFFGAHPYQEVDNREYSIAPGGTIHIKNERGNVIILTEWHKKKVRVNIRKQAQKPEYLNLMTVQESHISDEDNNSLALTTLCAEKNIRGSLDYIIAIPIHANLLVSTGKGSIIVHECSGPITASTDSGDIRIFNTKDTVAAKSTHKGSIFIGNAEGTVQVAAHKGNISVQKAYNNIEARTDKGNIHIACATLPSTGIIDAESSSGAIHLELPDTVNAHIQGKTDHGTLTCAHSVALKSQITTLDMQAWTRFKKELEGTVGNGDAHIKLVSHYGNIKIIKSLTNKRSTYRRFHA